MRHKPYHTLPEHKFGSHWITIGIPHFSFVNQTPNIFVEIDEHCRVPLSIQSKYILVVHLTELSWNENIIKTGAKGVRNIFKKNISTCNDVHLENNSELWSSKRGNMFPSSVIQARQRLSFNVQIGLIKSISMSILVDDASDELNDRRLMIAIGYCIFCRFVKLKEYFRKRPKHKFLLLIVLKQN